MSCENDWPTEKEDAPPLPDQSRKSQTHVKEVTMVHEILVTGDVS
jgi:hypothetical protein